VAIKKIFKSSLPYINYVTTAGRTCVFQEGRYLTDNPQEIAELTFEIKRGNTPHIYIDPEETEVDTTLQERIIEAQKAATLRVLEEHSAGQQNGQQAPSEITNPNASQGATVQVPQGAMTPAQLLGVTTSATIVGAQASNGGAASLIKK
jgi:hypothetical protein